MIVDDSVVVRRLVSSALRVQDVEVVGTAPNGRLAVGEAASLQPDVITMDIEMPQMNGIEAVRALRAAGNRTPVIMFSTLTERGASATLEALAAGATDYMLKPNRVDNVNAAIEQVRNELLPRIRVLAARHRGAPTATRTGRPVPAPRPSTAPAPPAAAASSTAPVTAPKGGAAGYDLLVIGCSTGGPEALAAVLQGLPGDFPLPILAVQHMPPVFTAQFAARLDKQLPFQVYEARDGQPVVPGSVFLAPGGHHLELRRQNMQLTTSLNQSPPVNYCRPAVDVLFHSAAGLARARALGLVLTGMGADGRDGSAAIVAAGGSVIVQDEATSVVWGMPGAVAKAQLAEQILPLAEIPGALIRRVAPARTGRSSE
ncbi:MAG: chemotaxis response regulator protein-glutamate methylesterase [Micrococcales bacterium]|nr:MAG: chemotaxis response regulator protein-glutamate methylesterase [Micrococcales bacterium]PIE26593.1 MAG: chemotaxis response regulator protein-glutamate methylesterase [Micrococcales bacterium]